MSWAALWPKGSSWLEFVHCFISQFLAFSGPAKLLNLRLFKWKFIFALYCIYTDYNTYPNPPPPSSLSLSLSLTHTHKSKLKRTTSIKMRGPSLYYESSPLIYVCIQKELLAFLSHVPPFSFCNCMYYELSPNVGSILLHNTFSHKVIIFANTYSCHFSLWVLYLFSSSVWQVPKLNDRETTSQPMNVLVHTEKARAEDEDDGGCELSLSLTLPNPSPQRSNVSSASEISEAISSCPGFPNYKGCSSSSTVEDRINLDLSLALCGN